MCGRSYSTITESELEARYETEKLKRDPLGKSFDWRAHYNTCPTEIRPVIVRGQLGNEIRFMRWGLVPAWAESVKDASKYSLINARAEEIETKKSYSEAFRKRRCIVPVSGFYEWRRGVGVATPKKEKAQRPRIHPTQESFKFEEMEAPKEIKSSSSGKTPFAIRLQGEKIMSIAGVWESWVDKKSGEVVESFALITTSANEVMSAIHDRMPVILKREDEAIWLGPKKVGTEAVAKLLVPCESSLLESYEISTAVNSPKNNTPEILERVR